MVERERERGRGRRSHLPGQLRPLEQPRATIPSWDETWKMLQLMTNDNVEGENDLINKNRKALKQAYDAWFDWATGKGRAKLDKFAKRSAKKLDELGLYTSFIRNKVMSRRD